MNLNTLNLDGRRWVHSLNVHFKDTAYSKIKRLEKTIMFQIMMKTLRLAWYEDMETSIANAGTVRTRVEFIVLGKRSIRFDHLSNCKAKL